MKKLVTLLLALVCAFSLVGCGTTKNTFGKVEVNHKFEGTQIADINIKTNTTMISVTADDISGDTEISLFLYYAEDLNNPILYEFLTKQDNSVDFTNLTSACTYKIGAEIKNSDQSVMLTITD